MAVADRTFWSVNGQAYEFDAQIINTSFKAITGGLTAITATISKDGGAFASLATTPVEIGTTGVLKVSLSATEMTCNSWVVKVTVSNANAQDFIKVQANLDLTPFVGRYDSQSVQRLEHMHMDMQAMMWNHLVQNAGTTTLSNLDGSTKATGTYSQAGFIADRSKIV